MTMLQFSDFTGLAKPYLERATCALPIMLLDDGLSLDKN